MNFSTTITLILITGLWSVVTCNNCTSVICKCNAMRQCKLQLKIPPNCNKRSEGKVCMDDLKNTSDCSTIKDETKVLYRLSDGLKIADDVACDHIEFRNEYKLKPHCWLPAVQCSQFLAFGSDVTEQFCYERKLVNDFCKKMEYIGDDCKELHVKFLDLLFKATACRSFKH